MVFERDSDAAQRKITVAELKTEIGASGAGIQVATDTAVDDDYLADLSPAIVAYEEDLLVKLIPVTANTGAASINLNSVGALPIYSRADGQDPVNNDILAGEPAILVYCSACNTAAGAFMLLNPATSPDAVDIVTDHGSLGGLDIGSNDHFEYTCVGCASVELTLDTNGDVTIPSGGGVFSLDTFADAATDTLDTLACAAGNSFVLRAENVARVVTIDAASIPIYGNVDFAFDEAGDRAFGICPATNSPIIERVFSADGIIGAAGYKVDGGGYNLRTQWPVIEVFPNGTAVVTGDQQACFLVPGIDDCTSNPIWCTAVAPLNLTAAGVMLGNDPGITTGVTVQISRKRLSDATTKGTVDTLSTLITTDATEFSSADATTPAAINTSNDDAAPGDEFCADVDAVPTGAEGLRVWMRFAP
jgi:hypothetical protein